MPLIAYLYSQKIFAPLLNENEWEHIRSSLKENPEYLHFKCCQSPVYARVSKNGLKHFVHKNTDHCNYVYESEDHLLLKMEVFEACQNLGWNTEVEFAGEKFRTDVLAQKDGQRVAFEIQLSRQDLQTTIERQNIFKEAGVRCVWFFKRLPSRFYTNRFLPAFELIIDHHNILPFQCNLTGKQIPVKKCVELLLEGKVKFRKKLVLKKQQKAEIYLFDEDCWRCEFQYKAIGAWSTIKSQCGIEHENGGFEIETLALETKKVVKELRHTNIAVFKKSFSRAKNRYVWANHCPRCRSMLEPAVIDSDMLNLLAEKAVPVKVTTFEIDNADKHKPVTCHHWCLKGPEGFCDN